MVAATERVEQAGSEQYQNRHMNALFKEGFSFSGYERDLLMMNLGAGEFLDISGVSGVDSISDGRGSVFADFDNDGDVDIFLTTGQGEAHYLFRNNVGNTNRFLRVDLEGTAAGRDAFGAVVRVKTSAGVQTKIKAGGSGFLSQHDSRLLFGLGSDEGAEWAEVTWPGGDVTRVDNVPANSAIRIVEGVGEYTLLAENRFRLVGPLDPEEAWLARLDLERDEPFPNLALRSESGESIELHDLLLPGRNILVNVWATWCAPCAAEMPELQRLYPDLEEVGIDLVGVSIDFETVDNVPAFLQSNQITYPVYTTNEATLEALYPRGEATVPLTVLLDDKGRVLEVHSGWSWSSEQALRRLTARGAG